MKNLLLILGIVCIVACVLLWLFFAVVRRGHLSLRDGTAAHYARLQSRAKLFLLCGALSAVLGAACLLIRSKL